MSTEGFPEDMLASAFDYMVQEEKVGKAFMAKAPRLRKLNSKHFQPFFFQTLSDCLSLISLLLAHQSFSISLFLFFVAKR
jgi:hypothetical protein